MVLCREKRNKRLFKFKASVNDLGEYCATVVCVLG